MREDLNLLFLLTVTFRWRLEDDQTLFYLLLWLFELVFRLLVLFNFINAGGFIYRR